MTQAKHTPAPWAQERRRGLDGQYRTQVFPADDPDNAIATVHWHSVPTEKGHTTDREANARLIAAAPDMLEALQEFCRRVEAGEIRSKRTYAAFKALIARATGQ